MIREYEERKAAEERAMKDPKKAEFAKMFKEKFPDVPITFK